MERPTALLPNTTPYYLEVLVTQRRYFQMSLLIIWKYWSHRGASSKCHSLLFGSIGHSDALPPNIKLHFLEVWCAQQQFFQIFISLVWRFDSRNGCSSKYSPNVFGSVVCAKTILPNNHLSRLEVWSAQRLFFQVEGCRANEAFVIVPGRPFNICALLAAAPQKGRGKSSGDLWPVAFARSSYQSIQNVKVSGLQREVFHHMWKNGLHQDNSFIRLALNGTPVCRH